MNHDRASPGRGNGAVPGDTRYGHGTVPAVGQSGQRTIAGAVAVTSVPVAVVVAASYPATVAGIVAACTFAATGYVSGDAPSDDSTRRSGHGNADQN